MRQEIIDKRNQYTVSGGIATLTIVRQNGDEHVVTFDADLLPVVNKKCWRILTGRCDGQYVVTGAAQADDLLFLHHLVVGVPEDGKKVYYRNLDTLDCRRSNLLMGDHKTVMTRGRHTLAWKAAQKRRDAKRGRE